MVHPVMHFILVVVTILLIGCAGPSVKHSILLNIKGSKGGQAIVETTNDSNVAVAGTILKWKQCAPNEMYLSEKGKTVIIGTSAICKNVPIGMASVDDNTIYILTDKDSVANAFHKTIAGKLEIVGDLVGKLTNNRILIIKKFTAIKGLISGSEIDAILRPTNDNFDYYEVLSKSGDKLAQLFNTSIQGQDMQYRLKGIKVNKDGTLNMDVAVQMKDGQSIKLNNMR